MGKTAILLLVPLALVLSACSSLKPPPDASHITQKAFKESRTLPNAVAVAESLRDAYLERSADMRKEERLNGLALIGMGMLVGDFVARGVGKSETLALGLGGVGLYSANNWSNPKSERLVYAEAAGAVQCAISVFEPMRPAYDRIDALEQGLNQLKPSADGLNDQLRNFSGSEEPRVVRARNAVIKARAAASAADVALGYLKTAGSSLYTAIGGMRVDVEVQLVRGAPDYGTLVASLIQQKVLPATAPLALANSKVKESATASILEGPTALLEAQTAAVEQLVAMLNLRPSEADLQRCRVDPATTGVTMKVEPSVIALRTGERAVALASGGSPPYKATVVADPSDQLTASVAENGIVTVEARTGAKAATYTVQVSDKYKGRETLSVTVSAASPAQSSTSTAPTPSEETSACANPDPAVKELQTGLRALGITKATVEGSEKELMVDGCAGKVTNAAMKRFYIDLQNMQESDVQKNEAKLLAEATADVKAAVAKKKPPAAK